MGIAIAGTCAVAGAAPTWDVGPGLPDLVFTSGQSTWVDVRGHSPTLSQGFQGFELYAVVTGPFAITGVLVDQPGAGTAFEGNSTGAYMDLSSGQGAIAMVTTAQGFVPDGSIKARLLITALPGAPVGATGELSTDGTEFWGAPSNFADGRVAVQDSLRLIIPEPAVLLQLLLGAGCSMRARRVQA